METAGQIFGDATDCVVRSFENVTMDFRISQDNWFNRVHGASIVTKYGLATIGLPKKGNFQVTFDLCWETYNKVKKQLFNYAPVDSIPTRDCEIARISGHIDKLRDLDGLFKHLIAMDVGAYESVILYALDSVNGAYCISITTDNMNATSDRNIAKGYVKHNSEYLAKLFLKNSRDYFRGGPEIPCCVVFFGVLPFIHPAQKSNTSARTGIDGSSGRRGFTIPSRLDTGNTRANDDLFDDAYINAVSAADNYSTLSFDTDENLLVKPSDLMALWEYFRSYDPTCIEMFGAMKLKTGLNEQRMDTYRTTSIARWFTDYIVNPEYKVMKILTPIGGMFVSKLKVQGKPDTFVMSELPGEEVNVPIVYFDGEL